MPSSDIDVLCHAPDPRGFAVAIWTHLARASDVALYQWIGGGRPVVARFTAHGWPFEIFASPVPVRDQAAWRHFSVERRLLALGGDALRTAVMVRRHEGLKTEPAFAAVLGLGGDAYAALLDLAACDDAGLAAALAAAGFGIVAKLETPSRPA